MKKYFRCRWQDLYEFYARSFKVSFAGTFFALAIFDSDKSGYDDFLNRIIAALIE